MQNKIKNLKNIFLNETYEDTWSIYEKSLTDSNFQKWDWIVLTASNEEQANTYRSEINYRLKIGMLSKDINYTVVSDPDGKRVGSGGATLNVLKYIHDHSEDKTFKNKKILIIHSGGDSKRIPQYSSCGKLFSPVQRELPNGRASSLFDEFIIAFSALPSRISNGVLLASGDVLLVFNPLQVDLHYTQTSALSIKAPVTTGCNHGVFLSDKKNSVVQFLHKQSIESLQIIGAVNSSGNVDIDTGTIFINSQITEQLFSLISTNNKIADNKFNKFVNEDVRLNLYGDFLYPLAQSSTLEQYYREQPEYKFSKELKECRKKIWDKLHNYEMKIVKLSPANFIHFGTTLELTKNIITNIKDFSYINWKRSVISNVNDNIKYCTNNSYIQNSNIGNNSYIENSVITNCSIGNNVILSGVEISNLSIPDNIVLNTLKLKNGKFITRIYSINDNPKLEKTLKTPFLNNNLEKMLSKYNISESIIWQENNKSLWNAHLYLPANTISDSIKNALNLLSIVNCTLTDNKILNKWLKGPRESLKSSFLNCNTTFANVRNRKLDIIIRTDKFINAIENQTYVDNALQIILKSSNVNAQLMDIIKKIECKDSTIKYKFYLAISTLLKKHPIENLNSKYFENLCYDNIKSLVHSKELNYPIIKEVKPHVKVELPIRVNFGGGWSDTPPCCMENGGSVLNASFKLDGTLPIKAEIKKIDKKIIILRSIDLNVYKEYSFIEDLKDCYNPLDCFALLKASLITSTIIRASDKSINDVFKRTGSGFEFITDATLIPKGSGLGTSSILSGTCLKALYEFINVKISDIDLCYKVLEQEQLMSTGGGWQDQIGGVIPGIKYTTTTPNIIQKFNVSKIDVSPSLIKDFNNRFVLIYTGQRRLAKNLLREVMNKYISSNPETINLIKNFQELARLMKIELENNNFNNFTQLLNKHWELSKKLDPGCTNTCINQILSCCEDLIDGKMICGAGRRRIFTSSIKTWNKKISITKTY